MRKEKPKFCCTVLMERSEKEWLPAVLARFFPGEVEVHLEGDMAGVSCDLDGEKSVMSPLLRVRQ